jgi:Asp-tRNA(Asn)/Glu-tRNA(Gln) amidotransferase A subunit family amidase
MALAALETDAYGSLRLSSASCGLFGLKTGRAATPLREDLLVPSYERRLLQRGVISRTPEELRHVARVLLCGQSAKGLETDSNERAPLKVAWSADLGYIPCQDGVQSQMKAAIERFKGLGADVERIELDLREDTAHHLHHLLSVDRYLPVIQLCEAYPDYFASLSSETRDWLAVGNAVSGVQYSMACSYMVWLRRHVLARLKGYDVLLTPVSPLQDLCGYDVGGLPSCVGGALFDAQLGPHSFLLPFNLIGLPAMTLPCGLSEQGHPQAVQVLGNRGREVTLMALADAWDEQGEYSLLAPEIAKMPY